MFRFPSVSFAVAAGVLSFEVSAQSLAGARAVTRGGASATPLLALDQTELAGVPTVDYPRFTHVRAFNEGDTVRVALDAARIPGALGLDYAIYVTRHRSPDEWTSDPTLTHDSATPMVTGTIASSSEFRIVDVDVGSLSGDTGSFALGVGYDVVVDFDGDGRLGPADLVDGWGDEAGFYVVPDMTQPGPLETTEFDYNGGRFLRERVYHPTELGGLPPMPLVVISHGNGHDYTWYGHLGHHLASWGFVVMSHTNNTGPGIESASTTTLRNTEHFIANLSEIRGGRLDGYVDPHRIVWMGHSRGGEGVARAYDRAVKGDPIVQSFTTDDIKLISSIAPTDFLGGSRSNPHSAPFHLWTGGADADVNGCANADLAQTFHLHDRATGERMSISLHGVGHGDFHDGGGSSVAMGPCLVGRDKTHRIMKGYALPLLKYATEGNLAAKDFLWRQWESIRPISAPISPCVVVDLMYQPASDATKFVLDDFQSGLSTDRSSSNGVVFATVLELVEDRLDDRNDSFSFNPNDPMNGMTLGGAGDDTRGTVFEWDGTGGDRALVFEVRPEFKDVSGYDYLAFRAAQSPRHPLTTDERGDLNFTVELFDRLGGRSAIRIGTYGGGIEEPYNRGSCGAGRGWASEFETIRIPLEDFKSAGRPLELSELAAVLFRFGPRSGSSVGRIGLDEIEFVER